MSNIGQKNLQEKFLSEVTTKKIIVEVNLVNGIVIKSHGNADSHAFANAIDFGVKAIESDLLSKIKSNASR